MNEVLDRIERALTAAVRRSNARRRRRRSLVATTATGLTALLTAGIGLAAVSGVPSPIERLLGGGNDFGQRPGTPRLDLRLTDPGGLRWTATAYFARSRDKAIVRATVETTFANGTSSTRQSARLCVSRRCGVRFPKAG